MDREGEEVHSEEDYMEDEEDNEEDGEVEEI